MTKMKRTVFALAMVASTAMIGCKKKYDVEFWSSFGANYTQYLDPIVTDIANELGYKIQHVSKKSYPGVLDAMVSAIATGKYPGIAVGYPDHFAQYHGSKILIPLDSYVSGDMLADYHASYMPENYLYDQDGSKHLYGVPFNKSTELLGYNGVFVDYADEIFPGKNLKVLPQTWEEWADIDNPESKVSYYMQAFDTLRYKDKAQPELKGKVVYATQEEDGHCHDFHFEGAQTAGQVKVFDYSKTEQAITRLFSWDSTDNAFITLVRQWGAKYTELPADQHSITPKKRQGHVLAVNEANYEKTIDMLKFFNHMHKDGIFGTAADLGGSSFSSDAFSHGNVMFMVCSSGGLGYNTGNWQARFSLAPIPFKEADKKFVISQGANICMTKAGDQKKSFEVIKALTTGKYQTRWTLETGYFPASKSSENSAEYQAFLNSTSYADKDALAKREGAKVNHDHYSSETEGWIRFVDDAFIGSAAVRTAVGVILGNVFKNIDAANVDNTAKYIAELKNALTVSEIKSNGNIAVEFASVFGA